MVRQPSSVERPKLWLASSRRGETPPSTPRPTLDDAQLLESLRKGDPSAATSLHDRVRPQVAKTVDRLLGHHDVDREDVAQLAMIEMVTTVHRFRGDCSLDTWTSMVTARVIYKHIRRRRTERRIFDAVELGEENGPSSRSTGRDVAARATFERVRVHLERMDESRAWAFLLHDVWGYDLREIAEITGASMAAAQTRLTRGRRELHESIAMDPELANALDGMEAQS